MTEAKDVSQSPLRMTEAKDVRESVAVVPDERGESVAFPDELDEEKKEVSQSPRWYPVRSRCLPRSEDTKDVSQCRRYWWSR
jgi:hypothetical protein